MSIVAVPKTSRKPQPCQYSTVPAPAKRTIATATRSCASPRKALAERAGFEPARLSPTAFRERHHQPLGHLSTSKSKLSVTREALPLRVDRRCCHVPRAPRGAGGARRAERHHHVTRVRIRMVTDRDL